MESATHQQQQRPPRTNVYVPRHRRTQNPDDDAQETMNRSSTPHASSNRGSGRPLQRPSTSRQNSTDSYGSNSPSNTDHGDGVVRRGRGKFLATSGSSGESPTLSPTSSTTSSSSSSRVRGAGAASSDWRGGGQGNGSRRNPASSSSSSTHLSNRETPLQPQPSRPPRGRGFDATVLNVYDDDRPRYSRSNSSQYRRSNHSSGNSSPRDRPSTPEARMFGAGGSGGGGGGGGGVNASSWRATEPSLSPSATTKPKERGDSVTPEALSRSRSNSSGLDSTETTEDRLAGQFKVLFVADQEPTADKPTCSGGGGKEEELEEWELAMQNSDEDAIPKPPTLGNGRKHKTTATSATSPEGNASSTIGDTMCEDDYILELTNLAPSIKSVHVNEMFASFSNKSGGFRIKWLDDSHALVIFESAAVAKQAYVANKSAALATVLPYKGADKDAIRKAHRPSTTLTPSARPAKTDSVARRLVQGALGIRVRRTPEQVEQEKAMMAAAREAREAARQERQRERQETDAMFNQ